MEIQQLWQKNIPWLLLLWCLLGIIIQFNIGVFLAGLLLWVLLLYFTAPGLFWSYAYFLPLGSQNVKLLQKAVDAKPFIPNPYFILGAFWAKKQQYDQAIPLLETAVQFSSHRTIPKLKLSLAVIYREKTDFSKAVSLLRELINQGHRTYEIFINLATTYLKQNELNQALEAACQARSFKVNALEPVLVIGRVHFLSGDFAIAKDDYEWAVSHTSWPIESFYWLGRAELELGEIEAAIEHLKLSVARIAEDPHLSDIPLTEAERWLHQAEAIKPDTTLQS